MVETTGRGTLGQQQQVMMQEQQQGRVTRSDRKKAVEQERVAKYRFETGKVEAERLRTEVFIDKNIDEQYDYTYYIPTRYLDRYGNPTREWIRMSEKDKEYAIKQYYNRNTGYETATRRGYLKQFTEQRTKTTFDPFTFEEYEEEYEKLSPDVQQFFSSPVEIKAEKQKQKEVDLGVAQTKIESWQERITKEQERLENQRKYWDEYTKRDSYRRMTSKQKAEEYARHVRRMRDYDNKIDEYRASIRYLQGQWGKIGEGYKIQDLVGYAQDKSYSDWLRWDARSNQQTNFELNQAVADPKLMTDLQTLKDAGFIKVDPSKVSFSDYQASANKFNKDLAYTQQLQKWGGQVGFDKLPQHAQDKISSSIGLPKGEVPTFDTKGKLTNVQSAVFGGVYSAKDYETKVVDYQNTIEQAGGWDSYVQQQKDVQYKSDTSKFEEEDIIRNAPFKFIDAPIGYGSGMTINTLDTGKLLVASDYGDIKFTDPVVAGVQWTGGKIGKGFNWMDDRIHLNKEFSLGIVDPEKIKEKPDFMGLPFKIGYDQELIDARTIAREERSQRFSDRRDKLYGFGYGSTTGQFAEDKFTETKKLTGIKERDEVAFLKSDVGKDFYYKDFEDDQKRQEAFDSAWGEYRTTDVGQKFEKQYSDEYSTEFASQWKGFTGDKSFFSRWGTSTADFGLGLGQGISKLDTPLRIGTAGAVAYGGIAGIGALGKSVVGSKILTATSVGFTGYGLKTGFDPTKTDTERVGGFVTAGIGAFSLTKAGLKFMKAPSVKRVAVASKPTLKTEAMGLDNAKIIKKATGEIVSKKGVGYAEQKLSQVGVGGSRAVVSQRWRDLFNKYIAPLDKRIAVEHVGGSGMKSVLRFSTKPSTTRVASVYEGVPANQPAQFTRYTSVRGTTIVKTAPSGYERATKLLKDYGATDYQARATLRYYAPRVYETWIKQGIIIPSKDTARGIFSQEIRQPKVDLGGGIKTRAGQTTKDLMVFERKVIQSEQLAKMGKDLVGFKEQTMRFRTIGDKPVSQVEFTSGKAIGKASEIRKGSWKGFEYDWRKLGSISQQRGSLTINPKNILYSQQTQLSAKGSYLIDSKSFKPIKATKVSRTPTEVARKEYDVKIKRAMEKENKEWLADAHKKFVERINEKFLERISERITKPSTTQASVQSDQTFTKSQGFSQSEFYGQGMYEKTDSVSGRMFAGGSARNLQAMEQAWMKAPLQVDFAPPKAKFGKMFEVQTMTQNALKFGLASQVGLRMQQKQDQKQDVQLKMALKDMLGLKQQLGLKQLSGIRQEQTTSTTLRSPSIYQPPMVLKDPMFKSPPPFKTPSFFLPPKKTKTEKVKSRIRQMKMQEIRFEGLLPDFTSRALGLSPKEVGGVGDAMREIRKIQTGLGIRTGARFKKSNNKRGNISEKNLLRGIMN